jgi:hypothetical protein
MAFYFKEFPTVNYDIDKSNQSLLLTNLTLRFRILDVLKDRGVVFYNYDVKDSDRPDIIAEKLYGDGTLDWIILLTNDIVDPYYDWPLTQSNLENFITTKYGSISVAQANTHHYERILSKQKKHTDGKIIPERAVEVDLTTYNSLGSANRRLVTNYDFEVNENDKKRKIKLLDKRFIPFVKNEYKKVLR